ncbi:MAG: DUF3299 domain-containing protein [Planctomycetota bacterium]|jgi:hypothetical protein
MRYLQLLPAFLLLACCGIETDGEPTARANPGDAAMVARGSGEDTTSNGDNVRPGSSVGDTSSKPTTQPTKAPTKEPTTEAEEEAAQANGGAGMDAADLLAQRGAEAMLAAEKRLRDLLKAGKIKGIDRILPFEEISSWPYQDGLKGMPKRLKKLNGKQVLMTGFMLPIDEVENIKEFLLVQSLWGCCYGTPPDINGVVRVVMKGSKRIDYEFEPIKIIGTFQVGPTIEDGFCVDIYQLSAESVEVIK